MEATPVSRVTPFDKAGSLIRGLKPSVKKGKENTPGYGDTRKLSLADTERKSYDVLYPEQFNKQKQADSLSQQPLLMTITSCHWKDILISGLFALLKISAGVLILNAFALVAEGRAGFRYGAHVLALALWYIRSRLIGSKVRSLLASAVFEKQFSLSNAGRLMQSGGVTMKYGTVDAHRIGKLPLWFHPKWTPSFPLCISLIVLFRTVGLATFSALFFITITVLLNTPLSKLQHILNFLEEPELDSRNARPKLNEQSMINTIFIKSASFSWEENPSKPTLKNVGLEVTPGEKVAVYGGVGSGKSTLLAAILGEVPKTQGTIQVSGRIAHVSQRAWILNGTVLDNILFGSDMDFQRYQHTLERCSLLNDLESLPCGDLTEIGERGVSLTDGVMQRIQLARALYQDADIYLLDDPFGAMEAEMAKSLFNEYVMGALARKTVLFVTHKVDFLPAFNTVLLLSDGEVQAASQQSQKLQELVNARKETTNSEEVAVVTPLIRGSSAPETNKNYVEKKQTGYKGDQLIKQQERDEAVVPIFQEPIRCIPDVIRVVGQAKVAFARIAKFQAPELQSRNCRQKVNPQNVNHSICFKSAIFSWEENPSKPTLKNISLEVMPGEKVAVCGKAGSGKSTLLAAILGKVPKTQGITQVDGRIAFVSNTARIQDGTILDNILFGTAMDCQKYQDTLERCSLLNDLESLPCGDLTEVGEEGVKLSGAQKQRIQLARALYQDADIYLLDDPFSAMDAETARSLSNEYVKGALARKTVLLATNQYDFLPAFNSVLLMSDGEILQTASYHQLLSLSQEFQKLVNAHKETSAFGNHSSSETRFF